MQLGVRLSTSQHAKLAAMARRIGKSKSDVIRHWIDTADPEAEVDAPPAPTEEELLELLAERRPPGQRRRDSRPSGRRAPA